MKPAHHHLHHTLGLEVAAGVAPQSRVGLLSHDKRLPFAIGPPRLPLRLANGRGSVKHLLLKGREMILATVLLA